MTIDTAVETKRSADGLGYRAKIGLLVPATNTICQPECDDMRPVGVTNHVARMAPTPRGAETGDMEAYARSLRVSNDFIKDAMDSVMLCRPDLIVLGHSINTFRDGPSGVAGMKNDLEDHSGGVEVILPSIAFLAALSALGLRPNEGKKLSFITPYWPPADEQVRNFFTQAGYEVKRVIGFRRPGAVEIAETPTSDVIAGLSELAKDPVDAIIEPGSNLATARIAAQACVWLNRPVISCNTATYWHALRRLGIRDRRTDFGPLFANH